MDKELAPMGINTLVLRVDYNHAYTSRPEFCDENPLPESDVKKLIQQLKNIRYD